MPTLNLVFQIPEEDEAWMDAVNGPKYRAILWDLDQELRQQVKYGELAPDVEEALRKVRTRIGELADEKGVEVFV